MFTVPVDDEVVLGRIVLVLGTNVLVAVYAETLGPAADADVTALDQARPTFLAEVVDVLLRDGDWPVIGWWEPPVELPIPVSKVHVQGSEHYYEQFIDGTLGRQLSSEEAALLNPHRSYSPEILPLAVRAFHGRTAWLPAFDHIRVG